MAPQALPGWDTSINTLSTQEGKMNFRNLLQSVLSLAPSLASTLSTPRNCKPMPGSSNWPDNNYWNKLNSSIDGRLTSAIPPGAVCHPDWPQYNNDSCTVVANQWTNTSFHALNPVSVDYNDETCPPNPDFPCSATGYPNYVVEAVCKEDVQHAVSFARETGVRVVIKGTGHDFLGRSSGSNSLSIYTHHIRGLDYTPDDPRATTLGGVGALKIYAGERMVDIYAFAADHNITVVGGADPNVGIGGWISGGGHSPISAKYGMGADHVLDMEIVTADGELRIVNEKENADLFWALRGGGASTFAVLISVTVKVHPAIPGTFYLAAYNTTGGSDTFWSLSTYFHTQLPKLAEAGIMGYYYILPQTPGETNSSISGKVITAFLAPELSPPEVDDITRPMEEVMTSSKWGDPVYISKLVDEFPDFTKYWRARVAPEAAGISARLGSRLLGRSALETDFETLKKALKTALPPPYGYPLLGHLVAGPGTRSPPGGIAGGDNAILPAWRDSYAHIILPAIWPLLNETAKKAATTDLRDVRIEALRKLNPEGGAYMNEVDPTEPDWQKTLFGGNYQNLLEIKNKWDPRGVFWCHHCVGSELWTFAPNDDLESGIGEDNGILCKK